MKFIYKNPTPNAKRATPIYGSAHVTKAKPKIEHIGTNNP